MSREIWVDGRRTDRMPERSAAERLRYARQMVVRHRWDTAMYLFWTGALERLKRQCGGAAEK